MTIEKCQIVAHLHKVLDYTPYDVRWVPATPKLVAAGTTPRGTGVLHLLELQGAAGIAELAKVRGGLLLCL